MCAPSLSSWRSDKINKEYGLKVCHPTASEPRQCNRGLISVRMVNSQAQQIYQQSGSTPLPFLCAREGHW